MLKGWGFYTHGFDFLFLIGTRLLSGGDVIQIWEFIKDGGGDGSETSAPTGKVHFTLGEDEESVNPVTQRLVQAFADQDLPELESEPGIWECVWKIR